jgi:hypothetical protein
MKKQMLVLLIGGVCIGQLGGAVPSDHPEIISSLKDYLTCVMSSDITPLLSEGQRELRRRLALAFDRLEKGILEEVEETQLVENLKDFSKEVVKHLVKPKEPRIVGKLSPQQQQEKQNAEERQRRFEQLDQVVQQAFVARKAARAAVEEEKARWATKTNKANEQLKFRKQQKEEKLAREMEEKRVGEETQRLEKIKAEEEQARMLALQEEVLRIETEEAAEEDARQLLIEEQAALKEEALRREAEQQALQQPVAVSVMGVDEPRRLDATVEFEQTLKQNSDMVSKLPGFSQLSEPYKKILTPFAWETNTLPYTIAATAVSLVRQYKDGLLDGRKLGDPVLNDATSVRSDFMELYRIYYNARKRIKGELSIIDKKLAKTFIEQAVDAITELNEQCRESIAVEETLDIVSKLPGFSQLSEPYKKILTPFAWETNTLPYTIAVTAVCLVREYKYGEVFFDRRKVGDKVPYNAKTVRSHFMELYGIYYNARKRPKVKLFNLEDEEAKTLIERAVDAIMELNKKFREAMQAEEVLHDKGRK